MKEQNGKSGLVETKESSIKAVPKVKLKSEKITEDALFRLVTQSVSCEGQIWPNEKAVSERMLIRCAKVDANGSEIGKGKDVLESDSALDESGENPRTDVAECEGITMRMRSRIRIKPQDSRVVEMKRKKRKKIDAIENSDCVVTRLPEDFQMLECERSSSPRSPGHRSAVRYSREPVSRNRQCGGSRSSQLKPTEPVLKHECGAIGLRATGESGEAISNGIGIEIGEDISKNERRKEGSTKSDLNANVKRCESDEPMRTAYVSGFKRKKMEAVVNAGDASREKTSPAEGVSHGMGIGTECKSGTKATDVEFGSGNKATNAESASDSRNCKIRNESSREVKVVLTIDAPKIKETESVGAENVGESERKCKNGNEFRTDLYEDRNENRNELCDNGNEFGNELCKTRNEAESISDPEVHGMNVLAESISGTAVSGTNVLAESISGAAVSGTHVLAESIGGTVIDSSTDVLGEIIRGTAIDGGTKVKAQSHSGTVKNSSAKSCAKCVNGRDALHSGARYITKSIGGVAESSGASSVKSAKSRRSGQWNCQNVSSEFLLKVLGKEETGTWMRSLRHGRVSESASYLYCTYVGTYEGM